MRSRHWPEDCCIFLGITGVVAAVVSSLPSRTVAIENCGRVFGVCLDTGGPSMSRRATATEVQGSEELNAGLAYD